MIQFLISYLILKDLFVLWMNDSRIHSNLEIAWDDSVVKLACSEFCPLLMTRWIKSLISQFFIPLYTVCHKDASFLHALPTFSLWSTCVPIAFTTCSLWIHFQKDSSEKKKIIEKFLKNFP